MRILVANDGFGDAGGVQTYLDAVLRGLRGRGHVLAILQRDREAGRYTSVARLQLPTFTVEDATPDAVVARVRAWQPDVCYSHNMNDLAVEAALAAAVPTVKFMHGYFGTCVGGLKRRALPVPSPCDRVFGPACLALYLPCRCGQLDPALMVRQYQWASRQRALLAAYRAIVVASEHMKREFVRHGAEAGLVQVNPLFATDDVADEMIRPRASSHEYVLAFAGRMTNLKGGDLLVRAAALARNRLPRPVRLLMIGDGPQRRRWEALAARVGVPATFTGWLTGDTHWATLARAHAIVVPGTWPEPFGLVGLEAGALGVPAVAFDVGGVRQWLRPRENGVLVPAAPPRATALADGLVELLQHPGEYADMQAGARRIAREMSLARHLGRLESILARAAVPDANPARR